MKKLSTVRGSGNKIFKGHKLTIGLDLGDRSSYYCVLDEAGKVIQEASVGTTKKAMTMVLGSMDRCRIGMEVGTHSPWVSRLLLALVDSGSSTQRQEFTGRKRRRKTDLTLTGLLMEVARHPGTMTKRIMQRAMCHAKLSDMGHETYLLCMQFAGPTGQPRPERSRR